MMTGNAMFGLWAVAIKNAQPQAFIIIVQTDFIQN